MIDFFDFHHHHKSLNGSHLGLYNLSLEEEAPTGYFSAGIHPQDTDKVNSETWEWLKSVSSKKNCLAIGECGLDGRNNADDLQEDLFIRQIHLANALNKPVIIHCVRRYAALMQFYHLAKVPLVIHGYHKKANVAKELLSRGFYLSFGSALLRNVSLQSVAKEIPVNRLFLETDNSNESIEDIYHKTAELKNITLTTLKKQISDNLENIIHGR